MFTATITRVGVEVPKDAPVAPLIRKQLHVAPLSLNDPFPKKFKVYLENDATFVVPLHWARAAFEPFAVRWIDRRSAGVPANLTFHGSLRPDLHQPEAADAVLKAWQKGGGAMLVLAVGMGKTQLALYLASMLKKKTLVLVHKSFLAEQWVDRVRQCLPGAKTSRIQGDVCDTSGDVVVAMIQTLLSRKYAPSVFEPFGLVVADECFPYDQLIMTERGPMPIGDVYQAWRAGQSVRVQSFDEGTRTFSLQPVTHAWEKRADALVKVRHARGELTCTPNHRILTTDGWKEAGALREGELLVSNSWSHALHQYAAVRVDDVTTLPPQDTCVYDVEVRGTHTFVCVDERGDGVVVHNCHHLGAAAFSQVMWGQCAPYTLTLSATPVRKDGLTRVVEWFGGPVAFLHKRQNQDTTEVRVVKYSCAAFDQPPPVNRRGDVCFASVLGRLVDNAERTEVIARLAAALVAEEDRDVLVLTHRRQHVLDLAHAIRQHGVECGTYMGGDKEAPNTKVLVATYSLTSEGFDMPRLNALVLATPASDVEQSCGRVMRGSTTRGATIVDVVDQWGVCFAQHAKRRAYYKRTGFVIANDTADKAQDAAPVPQQGFAFIEEA